MLCYVVLSGADRKSKYSSVTISGHHRQVQEEVWRPGGRPGQDGGEEGLQRLHRDGDARRAGLCRGPPAEGSANSL